MKNLKSKALAVFVMLMAVSVCANIPGFRVMAASSADALVYVALGDSVPAGYALPDPETESYVGFLSEQMKSGGKTVETYNLARSGLTTTQLLDALNGMAAAEQAVLAGADVITLNIGGNNILGPVISRIGQIALDAGITGMDITNAQPEQIAQIFISLMTFVPDEALDASLQAGVAAFTSDFAEIIALLKAEAPNAAMIVSTVYNPIPAGLGLSDTAKELITGMNALILGGAETGGYGIADTYEAFTLAEAAGIRVTNVNLDMTKGPVSIDIHPNAAGHALMAQIHAAVLYPDMPVKRGMAVTLLHRLMGSPDAGDMTNPFRDVSGDDYSVRAVTWAAQTGLVKGYGNGLFGTEDDVSRQDLAVIIWKFQNITGYILPDILMGKEFPDWDDISDYAKSAVNKLTLQGITNSGQDGKFAPRSGATCADLAEMLTKFLGFLD
ncbi:MAG: GDSL-type esterase/lipase family protein [Oscillospiraceae bacterium]|jgi:lysophospholipase L1-like esterase|nr:GDSL-type esterase/lipase family protein [Oscillospiraceae bacterium]